VATPLDKTLKRELSINGRAYMLAISPEGLKITLKGRRKGLELRWDALVSGDEAIATALRASLDQLSADGPESDAQEGKTASTAGGGKG
jgi:hypothetical protein